MSDVLVTSAPVSAAPDPLRVLEGITLSGKLNIPPEAVAAQVASAIRRGHPQLRRQASQPDRVCLVGGGPSLADTEQELVDLVFEGAKLVTMNGSYQWCLERRLRPSCQVMIDARESNARFVEPAVPRCRYLLASQCHPAVWDAVAGRDVMIFHAINKDEPLAAELNAYYQGRWESVTGGTTVASRALVALRLLGYRRFDLFGVDCCWLGDRHHAYAQPENAHDRKFRVDLAPADRPELMRTFYCSGWHLKAFEDWLQMIRVLGQHFLISVHGDGLLAHALTTNATLATSTITEE